MDVYAPYNTLRAYKVNHKLILGLVESLYPGGTGLSDEAADRLIFPAKEDMIAYLKKTFARTE